MPATGLSAAGNPPIIAEKAASPRAPELPAPRHTLLVVDDEGLMRWTLRERLAREGYAVLEAEAGGEGLSIARERRVDLVLLDVHLPDVDGLVVLERLRAEGIASRVILMTAYGIGDLAERAAALGVSRCIAKPFDLDAMVALVGWELARG